MSVRRKMPLRPGRGRALTIGVFDGVHRGHQAIVRRLAAVAEKKQLPGAVLTFTKHPLAVMRPDLAPPPLMMPERKAKALAGAGAATVFLLPFTPALSRSEPGAFVRDTLIGKLGMRHLVVGYDFVFGKDGRGDRDLLRSLSKKLGFGMTVVGPSRVDGAPVSSTRVRQALLRGDIRLVQRLLGGPYRLRGKVVRGHGLGHRLGWPTANLSLEPTLLPREGVWGGKARAGGGSWKPFIANLGRRPTVEKGGRLLLEIHLLDFRGNLRGRDMEIELTDRLRGEKKFSSLEALTKQIARDEAAFRAVLKRR